mgnify:CR=1 FL=1
MNWVTAKEIRNQIGITTQTLYNWRKSKKIQYKEISTHTFLYDIDSVMTPEINNDIRKSVCYCRVSNTKQKQDLIKQEQIIRQYMVSNGIICDKSYTDIASGMNENRKDFNQLIDDVISGEISAIYISFKDRLTRFGFSYFERLFLKYNCKIIILNSTKEDDFQQELLDDVISIIHHFSMRLYSNRSSILKNTAGLLISSKNDDLI